jgi:hypothetical protein
MSPKQQNAVWNSQMKYCRLKLCHYEPRYYGHWKWPLSSCIYNWLKSNEIRQIGFSACFWPKTPRTPIKSPGRSVELNYPISQEPVTWRAAVIFTRNPTAVLVFLSSELHPVTMETMLDAQLHPHHQRATHGEHGNQGVTHSNDGCDSHSVLYE